MKRETSNTVRGLMEDVIPPILRDTQAFRWLAAKMWGKGFDELTAFRHNAPFQTEEQYNAIYEAHPRIHDDTDNSTACLEQIAGDVTGSSLLDVGCGTGYTLRFLKNKMPGAFERLAGTDIMLHGNADMSGLEFHAAKAEKLPFADNEFDTVLCTHVIEHVLDNRAAIAELRRVAKKRLIVIVPREREGLYTFNPHFHFFPYPHSLVRIMIPVPQHHECKLIGRDIYYREDLQ